MDAIVASAAGQELGDKLGADGIDTKHVRHIFPNAGWKISLDRGPGLFQQY